MLGSKRRWLVAWCFLALVLPPLGGAGERQRLDVDVTTTMTTATFSWSTAAATRQTIQIGIGDELPLVVPEKSASTTHDVTVAGLKPGTAYSYRIVQTAGGAAGSQATFATSPPGAGDFTVDGTDILLDGTPFFPVVKDGYACVASLPTYLGLGINVIAKTAFYHYTPCAEDPTTRGVEGWNAPPEAAYTNAYPAFLAALAGKAWGIGLAGYARIAPVPDSVAADPDLVGWIGGSGKNVSPSLPQPNQITFADVSGWPITYQNRHAVLNPSRAIPGTALQSDALFYSTPLQRSTGSVSHASSCNIIPQGTSVASAFDLAQRAWAFQKPFFDEVALSVGSPWCTGSTITPARVQAQVWLSLAGGATGVGYLTDVHFPLGSYIPSAQLAAAGPPTDFGVAPDVAAEAQTVNRRLAEIQPVLLAPKVATTQLDGGPVRTGARRYAGVTYVIAVNTTKSNAHGTFSVDGLANGTAQVLWEGRSLAVRGGRISDSFTPLAVHVYAIVP